MPETSKRGMGFNIEKSNSPTKGNNYLLAIGIGNYHHLPKLTNAVKDVKDIVQILAKKYQFLPDKVQTIINDEATKDSIVNGFKSLVERAKANDNVIIYFSGHGEYDSVFGEGYWMPVDAQRDNESQFIPNSYIKKMLGAINCHHLFVMVDSCFSDALFNRGAGRVANRLERDPSRWGLTSGKNEVLEGMEINANSPFAESILYLLETNTKPLGVAELCSKVIEVTATNSKNIPLGEPLNVNGHRGGQFIFHPKIDVAADWAMALSQNTIASFQAFLVAHPTGQNASRAKSLIYDLEAKGKWRAIHCLPEESLREVTQKVEEVAVFIQQYENAPDLNEALKLGELLEYKKDFMAAKGSMFKLRLFAQRETPFQEEAKQLIEDFKVEEPIVITPIYENNITSTNVENTVTPSVNPTSDVYTRPAFQEPRPVQSKKKSIRNLLIIGISSLVILLVGGGLIYQKFFRPSELESIRLLKDFSSGSVIIKIEEGKPPYGVTLFRNDLLKKEFQHEAQGDLDLTEHIDEAGDYEVKVKDEDERQFSEKFTIGEDWPGLPENKLVPPSFSTKTNANEMIIDIEEGSPPYQLQLRKEDKTVMKMTIEKAGQHIIDISEWSKTAGNYEVIIEDSKKQTEKDEITIIKESTPPTFEFSEMQYDFGEIQDGDKVTYVFEFSNIGSKPLVISSVRPSSRSITTYLSEKTIASGEQGELEITFNSRKRLGRQKKTVKIIANTKPKEIILTIKANVKKVIAETKPTTPVLASAPRSVPTPRQDDPPVVTSKGNYANISFNQNKINFGKVEEGKVVFEAMEFYNLSDNELRISKVKSSCGNLIAKVSSKTISPKGKGRIEFQLNTKGKSGSQNCIITLYGNTNPIQKVIRVVGEVKSKPKVASAKPPPSYPHYTDTRDKKHYRIAKLKDGKTWMSENLNYETSGSWCYGNRSSNCNKYGRLYTHAAALKACPQGWHLPSQEEWDNLIKAYGGYPLINQKSDGKDAYNALIRGGKSGFRIDLGGIKGNQATNFSFREDRGFYWSSTVAGGIKYTYSFYNKSIQRHETVSNSAVSCRCVKD